MDKQRKRRILFAGIVILIVLAAIPLINLQSSDRKLNALLDLGEKYLEDLQYESAVAVFDEAIAIEPKCAAAYLGKAKAQYALKLYQDAIDTLREGIERVEDPTVLEAFLQQILNEIASNHQETSKTELSDTTVVTSEVHAPIFLNYTQIVRSTETDNPTIQLEVLGDNDEVYEWESSNPECAVVSDTGLVTCQAVAGNTSIIVYVEGGRDKGSNYCAQCDILIYDSAQTSITESECVRVVINDEVENRKQYMAVNLSEKDESQIAEIIKNVYFSGDVSIPEQLTFHNETIPITNISPEAFYWSYQMKSIFIPAFIESVGGDRYYSQNPFGFCLDLEEIKVDEKNAFFQVIDGVLFSKDGKQLIAYPAQKSDRTYTIPREVEKVYADAFSGCRNLEEILVEDGNQYYESIDGALIDIKANKLIAYPIGRKSVSYTVPENVTAIASDVFYGSMLEEVACRSVEEIYHSLFSGCKKLKKIECGQGTRVIHMSLYKNRDGIEIVGLDTMENLEVLQFTLSETQDIDAFSSLKNLENLSLDVNGRAVDLHSLGSLSDLKILELDGVDNVKDISWIGNMENLEDIQIRADHLDPNIDITDIGKLENIKSLDISGISILSDFSWISSMEKLEYVHLKMEKCGIKDISLLSDLPNLYSVSMYSQEEVGDKDILKQIEEMKAERPDVNFCIFE